MVKCLLSTSRSFLFSLAMLFDLAGQRATSARQLAQQGCAWREDLTHEDTQLLFAGWPFADFFHLGSGELRAVNHAPLGGEWSHLLVRLNSHNLLGQYWGVHF